jgi:serine/threonine protein kinase/Flp pilus assembly protein TadD
MSASESKSAIVLELAEEFLERYRQGERPSLKEYAERHPELAAEIRQVFPAMALMENIALADESLEGESASREPPPPAPLQQLGDFRIIREVGHGGMGVVYEAEQVSLGRHVALKVLARKMLLDARHSRRFVREAKAAARLHHTNIVPVFGVGEQDGLPYYVMQFIQGRGLDEVIEELRRLQHPARPATLPEAPRQVGDLLHKDVSVADVARSLLTGEFRAPVGATVDDAARAADPAAAPPPAASSAGSLSDTSAVSSSSVVLPGQSDDSHQGRGKKPTYWQGVAHIGVQVAGALAHAHGQGVLHRDIKPSNLLLDLRGTVWVTDFGLAKADDQQDLTHTGDILGTLRYMPPEAFEGKSDRRGDLYALGLTLYELLALRPAFDEKDRPRLVKQVTTAEPARLDRLNPAVPRDLVTIVHKAIDREPQRRYQTAGELAADLQHFLDDEPIQARRLSIDERGWRWCRHNPAVAGLLAALVVVFLGGFAGVTWKWREADLARADADQARRQAEERADEIRQGVERLNEANRLMQSGRRHADQGQWAEADRDLTKAVELRPDNSLVWAERADLYLRLGLLEEAAPDFAKQLKLQPPEEDVWLWFRHAVLSVHAGDVEGHRQICARMLARFGQTTDPMVAGYVAVSCALAPGAVADPFRAVELAKMALAKEPGAPWRLYDLGIALYRSGQYAEAVNRLRESTPPGSPRWARVLNWAVLAMAYHRLGQDDDARQWLDRVDEWIDRWSGNFPREGVPGLPLSWWDWAELQLLRREAGTLILGHPVPDRPGMCIARGRAHAALGRLGRARDDYTTAVELWPNDPRPRIERGRFHAGQQQWDKAVADFTRAIDLRPDDSSAWGERGRAYAHQARWDQAAADFATALALTPETPDPWSSESPGLPDEVAQRDDLFTRVVRERPADARLWRARFLWVLPKGQWQAAAAALARAIESDPSDHVCWYHQAPLLLELGDVEGYRRVCREMLDRFGQTNDPQVAERVVKTCLLAPEALADLEPVLRLAEGAVKKSQGTWVVLARGMDDYRAGQFARAVQRLRGLSAAGRDDPLLAAMAGVLQAMSYQRLGQPDKAHQALGKARTLMEQRFPQIDSVGYRNHWYLTEWVRFRIVRREAEALIAGKGK